MHKQLNKFLCCFLIYVTISLFITSPQTSFSAFQTENPTTISEEWDEETIDILQSSLSIVEIDREIDRLEQKLVDLEHTLNELDDELTYQEILLIEKQEAAGKVLRSYFMGERTELFFSLFNSQTLDSFLRKLDFYEFIMNKDRHILNSYKEQQAQLHLQYGAYVAEQIKIEQAKLALQTQREQVAKLELQIDEKLANRSDSEKILLLISELNRQWNEVGIEKIEHYLYLLNEAMYQFPTWIQQQTEYTKIKGLSYTVNLPEEALNAFLREQNSDFNNFSFSFQEGSIIAKGIENNVEIELTGHYTIINEPKHYIEFTIDSLYFNKFSLPQSTIDDLMSKYDLNFYPALIVSFLQATDVELSNGNLYIQLKLKI